MAGDGFGLCFTLRIQPVHLCFGLPWQSDTRCRFRILGGKKVMGHKRIVKRPRITLSHQEDIIIRDNILLLKAIHHLVDSSHGLHLNTRRIDRSIC